MKLEKKNEAISLRKNGLSVREISNRICVSKSSVSVWVRNIVLTKEQIEKLKPGGKNVHFFMGKRKKYQDQGREKAKEKDIEHAIGCMLYWGEGTKARNTLSFTNSDINVHKTFVGFLRKYFNVNNGEIGIHVNCYLDHGVSINEIYNYWIDSLDLNGCKYYKATIRDPSKSSFHSGRKKSKLKYGVMKLSVGNTKIIQQIYGSIQEYCGFIEPKWVN